MTEEFRISKPGKTYRIGKFFYLYKTSGLWWFRLWNDYGLHGKDVSKHPLLFSERNGYSKRLQIGSWSFRVLKPNAI